MDEKNICTLLDSLALDEATELVRRGKGAVALGGDGDAQPSEEDVQQAREKARQMLSDGRMSKINEGAEDARKLTFVSGSPVPAVLFGGLVENGRASAHKKKDLRRKLVAFMKEASGLDRRSGAGGGPDARTVGCMKVEFADTLTHRPNIAYMLLGECPRDHDLTAQLGVIYDRIDPDFKQTIINHLSLLTFCGKSAYAEMLVKNAGWVTEALQAGKHSGSLDPHALRVDHANTTFYLDPNWEKRVGIFVQLESDT